MKRYFRFPKLVALLGVMAFGCSEDFLNRPPEDSYVVDEWYQSAEQLKLAVNPLYGGVWFDYQRSWLNIGDVMAGNYHKGDNDAFYTFSINQATTGLKDAYASLWMAVAYSNSVVENIREKTPASVEADAKNTALGEALVWKSMAYFYLVRGWGAVPIIESNTDLITSGEANSVYRNRTEDVYEYIVRMLTEAAELLPTVNESGRISKYGAYGLLAKVYLTRSGYGQSGARKQEDLDKAKEYAGKVVNESGLMLEPEFGNLFTLNNGNRNSENLISWHWRAIKDGWGTQNAIQADLAVAQLTGFGDGWGTWTGPSIFLQRVFGENAELTGSGNRVNTDKRRKLTMMMDGDYYTELNRDGKMYDDGQNIPPSPYEQNGKGLNVFWDAKEVFASPTGAWARKHVVGNKGDNDAQSSEFIDFMRTSLSTHILRLADVYLVYAEAILGNGGTTGDGEALKVFNAVRKRASADPENYVDVTEISFEDIFEERIKELAFEGDNWFDYVRLAYYNEDAAINKLASQERGYYDGNADKGPIVMTSVNYTPHHDDFLLPIPEVDILKNPNLLKDPVPYDFDN
jgi:hypothetical protein